MTSTRDSSIEILVKTPQSVLHASMNPYRSNTLYQEICDILGADIDYVCRTFEDSRSTYFWITVVCVFFLSLCKIPLYIVQHYSKPVFNPREVFKLDKTNKFKVENDLEDVAGERVIVNYHVEEREKYNSLDDQYQKNTKVKMNKAEALNNLRYYLYENDLKLEGRILKVTSHKLTDEEMIKYAETGTIDKPFATTQITFGEEVNKLLSIAIPNYVTLKKRKLSDETYVVALGDDYGFIEEKLKQVYQEPIRVTFKDYR